MDYQKVYNALISKRKEFPLEKTDSVYTELHHILPRCLGGTDEPENLVRLTTREHFLAHKLLVRIHDRKELRYALFLMSHSREGVRITSREFEDLRNYYAEIVKERNLKNKPYMSPLMKERWKDPFQRKSISDAAKVNALKQWEDEAHRELVSATNSKLITELWEDEHYERKVKEGRKRFFETNPWPWQRPRSKPTRHIWTLAATFYELYTDDSLAVKGKGYGCVRFSNDFCNGNYENIFSRMARMFKEGWVPRECPAYLEEFGDRM